MFTGIITDVATVTAIEEMECGKRMTLECSYDMNVIPLGASIACDGACMTVIEKLPLPTSPSTRGRSEKAPLSPPPMGGRVREGGKFTIEISPESLDRTTLGNWEVGTRVNLERPVAVGGEFGGHFVTGHVDAVGTITKFEETKSEASRPSEPSARESGAPSEQQNVAHGAPLNNTFWQLDITYPLEFGVYLAPKGSVAVNGCSLTVNHVDRQNQTFSLMIIPHTLQETNLGNLKEGSVVNLEADLIARYLLAQQEEKQAS